MRRIVLRVTLDDFLLDIQHLFNYEDDDEEIDYFIQMWRILDDSDFISTLCKMVNIEGTYQATSSDVEDAAWEDYEDAKYLLKPELLKLGAKAEVEYELSPDVFFDFAYALVHYLEDWNVYFNNEKVIDIYKQGDRLDVYFE